MRYSAILLAPSIGLAFLGACTSTTTASPVVACGPDNVATTDWDVVATTDYEAAWYFAALEPVPVTVFTVAAAPTSTDPDASVVDAVIVDPSVAAASAVAAAVGNNFPNSCATASASGNVVTFHLTNCSGPLGLLASSGTITATLNVVGNAIQVQLAGSNITANGATINLSSSGTLTAANGQKTLQASSHSSGTGPYGNAVSHAGTYTVVWPTGDGCATINAALSGVGTGSFSGTTTQVTNYVVCTGKCPQSGTAISSFNGGTVTLTFNGSSNAQCNASDGTSASVALHCK
jgi:hypothetical protein